MANFLKRYGNLCSVQFSYVQTDLEKISILVFDFFEEIVFKLLSKNLFWEKAFWMKGSQILLAKERREDVTNSVTRFGKISPKFKTVFDHFLSKCSVFG